MWLALCKMSHGRPRIGRPRGWTRQAGHAQVTAQDQPALEAQEEVLPVRVDGLEPPAVEVLCDAGGNGSRMQRLHLDGLADKHLEVPRGAVQGVTLGHEERIGW